MRSHVLGLSYFDPTTGQSVLIAELTNSMGGKRVVYVCDWLPPDFGAVGQSRPVTSSTVRMKSSVRGWAKR